MAEPDLEKTSYGVFERFLYIFFIPVLFTAILSFVLLSLFDYDVKETMLRMANKIPVLNHIVPDPKDTSGGDSGQGNTLLRDANLETQVKNLKNKIALKNLEIKKTAEDDKKKADTIKQLEKNIQSLEEKQQTQQKNEEQYKKQLNGLASMYGQMSPSKAAPIMENLTPSELVLILSEMNEEERIRVLEKMDPKKAAAASIQLKDPVVLQNLIASAVKERAALNALNDPESSKKLNNQELGQTFASMTPKSAATVLLQMWTYDPGKVTTILSSMDSPSRSQVLTALTALSDKTASRISASLGK